MTYRAISIQHTPVEPPEDLVSVLLRARGWQIDYACTVQGDPLPNIGDGRYDAAIVNGGLESANDSGGDSPIPQEIDWVSRWVESGLPYFGICLGAQVLAKSQGAKVTFHPQHHHEIGFYKVMPTEAGKHFLPEPTYFYQWHKEGFDIPEGATLLASSDAFANQAFRVGRQAYGVQFHPEVTQSTIDRWLESGVSIDYPGAFPAEQQRADADKYLPGVENWLGKFIDRWLSDAGIPPDKTCN